MGSSDLPGQPLGLHMVVIPLFGEIPRDLPVFLMRLEQAGLTPVIVDNRREENPPAGSAQVSIACTIRNRNRGGISGALNRGVTAAIARGAEWITILDQDSRVDPAGLRCLLEPLLPCPERRLVVGPTIWDTQRNRAHERPRRTEERLVPTRLLISSGTTFHASHWARLGPFHEGLFIDYVDHYWSFRAKQRGYHLLRHTGVVLHQQFGHPHPNMICRFLGMQLYSPVRHFYSLRNLRWLAQQDCIPIDIKAKEMIKMMVKPWCWLLFEPNRQANLRAIIRALTTGVPRES